MAINIVAINKNLNHLPKIIVFDLDETLGYFEEFGIFWYSLTEYLKYSSSTANTNTKEEYYLSQHFFNELLDLFPEFLRPDIISILSYLKEKREKKCCDKVLIYTNNQGPKMWVEYIQNYFHKKLDYKIFEQIICAFKINGEIIEVCRSCSTKNIKDLIHCTKMPANTQIVFIDDVLYPKMTDDNIYYINVKPYVYCVPFEQMLDRLIDSNLLDFNFNVETNLDVNLNNETHEKTEKTEKVEKMKIKYKKDLLLLMERYTFQYVNKTKIEYKIDNIISKKIIQHLYTFFNKYYHNVTLKNRNKKNEKKTKKNYII